MSQHPDNAPTAATPDKQPEWQVWVEVYSPHFPDRNASASSRLQP
jgi:hypothetical protein